MSIPIKCETIVIEDDADDFEPIANVKPSNVESKYDIPNQYCALCLRERSLDCQFFEYRDENCSAFCNFLKDMLNFELNLDYVIVCATCCKMIDMVNNFKLSCLKARNFIEQVGLGLKCEDQWLAEETVQSIERIDETIRKHAEQMELAECDSKSGMEYESDQLDFSFGIEIGANENDDIIYEDSTDSMEINSSNPINPTINTNGTKQFKEIQRSRSSYLKCPICGTLVYGRFNLKEHMFTHGEATQQCLFCPKKFKQRTNLLRHHRMKHSDIPVRNLYPSLINNV